MNHQIAAAITSKRARPPQRSAPKANKLVLVVVVVVVMKQVTGRAVLATVTMREMVVALFQQGQRERQPEMVEVVERESRERYKIQYKMH